MNNYPYPQLRNCIRHKPLHWWQMVNWYGVFFLIITIGWTVLLILAAIFFTHYLFWR